jgi:hypothetical protein
MEINGCFQGWQQFEVGEDVRSPMTPIEHMHSLSRLGDKSGKRTQGACDWLDERRHVVVGKSTLDAQG